MDWTTVGRVLGSNFFIAVVSLATARWQISNAKEQLDKQLKNERERAKRDRTREIRSRPLLALRSELADFAARINNVILFGTIPDLSQITKALDDEVRLSLFSGDMRKILYSLDEEEIISKVKELMSTWGKPYPVDLSDAQRMVGNAETQILEIQSLINKRLEEL